RQACWAGAIERIGHVKRAMPLMTFVVMAGLFMLGLRGAERRRFCVRLVLAMLMLLLDLHVGLNHLASGGHRHLEQRQRTAELIGCLLDGRLLVARRGSMLEADDVHAGCFELHRDAIALDGDVEGP